MRGYRYESDGALIESWDDTTRTYTDHRTGWTRPYTNEENAAADAAAEHDALLTDLAARVARIEAHLWPAPETPTGTAGVQTFEEWGGIVPPGSLVLDAGVVYRNVSGVPLTTAPTAMPGGPSPWGHLWAVAIAPPSTPTHPAWSKDATYAVGDRVTHNGHTWQCLIAHGPERQGTWAPGVAHTIWADLGQNGA